MLLLIQMRNSSGPPLWQVSNLFVSIVIHTEAAAEESSWQLQLPEVEKLIQQVWWQSSLVVQGPDMFSTRQVGLHMVKVQLQHLGPTQHADAYCHTELWPSGTHAPPR